jgi:hypothetical protein
MKLLFDECVDERLRLSFSEYRCETARFAGLAGLKNGQLLDAAEAAGFDVLITVGQKHPKSTKPGRAQAVGIDVRWRDQPPPRSASSCTCSEGRAEHTGPAAGRGVAPAQPWGAAVVQFPGGYIAEIHSAVSER